MRLNTIITLSASAAFGLVAVFLARGWINDAIENEFREAAPAAQAVNSVPMIPVVVANVELGFGSELNADALRVVSFPEDAVPMGSFRSIDDLLIDRSQRTVALSQITINEAIIDSRISGPGGRGSLSALISEGMRAVTVRVDDVAGVAGFILPGDYVDIVYTRDEETRRNGNKLISDIILQNVKVLGIDQNLNDQSNTPDIARTVTLEVSNEEGQKLHLGMDAGKLSLTLRRSGEVTIEPTKTVKQDGLIRSVSRPAPRRMQRVETRAVPRPQDISGVAKVTIIRGDESEQVNVVREDIKSQTELAGG